jgi:hypothetical protein
MSTKSWLLACILTACDDRPVTADPADGGVVSGCEIESMPSSEEEARQALEARFECEGTPMEVACEPPEARWLFVPEPSSPIQETEVVGHEVIVCRATASGQAPRTFEFEVAELTIPRVDDSPGSIRCLQDGTATRSRWQACDPTEATEPPSRPDITTIEAARSSALDRLVCAGCVAEEHQVDCWGPAQLPFTASSGLWVFQCRIADLVRPAQLYSTFDFEVY